MNAIEFDDADVAALAMLERKREFDALDRAMVLEPDIDAALAMRPAMAAAGRALSRAVGVYWMARKSAQRRESAA
jgi:predicted lipid carrier protein YhbT